MFIFTKLQKNDGEPSSSSAAHLNNGQNSWGTNSLLQSEVASIYLTLKHRDSFRSQHWIILVIQSCESHGQWRSKEEAECLPSLQAGAGLLWMPARLPSSQRLRVRANVLPSSLHWALPDSSLGGNFAVKTLWLWKELLYEHLMSWEERAVLYCQNLQWIHAPNLGSHMRKLQLTKLCHWFKIK